MIPPCSRVFRGKAGGLPEPLTPFHVLLELAVTCEMKALALAQAGGIAPEAVTKALFDDSVGVTNASAFSVGDVVSFVPAPATISDCVAKAREGYKYVACGHTRARAGMRLVV